MNFKEFDVIEVTFEKERDFKQKEFKLAVQAGKAGRFVLAEMKDFFFKEIERFVVGCECQIATIKESGFFINGFFIIEFLYPFDREEEIRTGLKEFSRLYNFPIPF